MNILKMSILFLIFPLFLSGCATKYVEKTSETMSQTAYAIHDSAQIGRYDLLDGYTENLIKLVPPPKKKIVIQSFDSPYINQ